MRSAPRAVRADLYDQEVGWTILVSARSTWPSTSGGSLCPASMICRTWRRSSRRSPTCSPRDRADGRSERGDADRLDRDEREPTPRHQREGCAVRSWAAARGGVDGASLAASGGDSASWSGGGIAALIRGRLLGICPARSQAAGAVAGSPEPPRGLRGLVRQDPPQAPDRSAWPNQGMGRGVAVAPLPGAVPSPKALYRPASRP